jgi:hypothetical protein
LFDAAYRLWLLAVFLRRSVVSLCSIIPHSALLFHPKNAFLLKKLHPRGTRRSALHALPGFSSRAILLFCRTFFKLFPDIAQTLPKLSMKFLYFSAAALAFFPKKTYT